MTQSYLFTLNKVLQQTIDSSNNNKSIQYYAIDFDAIYIANRNTELVHFNQRFMVEKLFYELCKLDLACCICNNSIFVLHVNNQTHNKQTQTLLQNIVNKISNQNDLTHWTNTVRIVRDINNELPYNVLESCIISYIQFKVLTNNNMIKLDNNIYLQLMLSETQKYSTTGIDFTFLPNNNAYTEYICSIDIYLYRVKPVNDNNKLQSIMLKAGTLQSDNVVVLPSNHVATVTETPASQQYIPTNNDIKQYWLYKHGLKLPSQWQVSHMYSAMCLINF